VIVPLVIVAGIIFATFLRQQFLVGLWLFAGVWGVMPLLFATLTVTVYDDSLLAAFGIGLVRKRVWFRDVTSLRRVRNPLFYGYGIHYFPGGTLYNAAGRSAIEFTMATGRHVRIGTGEPDALLEALQQATGKPETERAPAGHAWGAQHIAGAVVGGLALVLAGSLLYVGFQPPVVRVDADALSVRNGVYRNTIPWTSIRTATLETGLPRIGIKTNGFAAGDTLRGNFRVDDWGVTRLYINRDSPPFLVIRTVDNQYVVVNFKDPERTRMLYSELTAQIDRSHR
jgi:hypothetical protein